MRKRIKELEDSGVFFVIALVLVSTAFAITLAAYFITGGNP